MSDQDDLSMSALFGLRGKNVVVTGGSKGVGYMISSGFVQAGCNVFIFSRKPDHGAAARLTAKGPGICKSYACDVGSIDAIEQVAAEVNNELGSTGLHILVNNSGAVWAEALEDTTKQSFDKIMGVNVSGVFFVTQAFLPAMHRAATEQDPARIINIASVDGLTVPTFEEYAYAASKSGVIHLSKTIAGHQAHNHITCNCISPGLFPSKMGDQVLMHGEDIAKNAIPLGRAGRAKDIVGACILLAGPSGSYTTGANLTIDGGVTVKPRM